MTALLELLAYVSAMLCGLVVELAGEVGHAWLMVAVWCGRRR
jgi:hypothetical protein